MSIFDLVGDWRWELRKRCWIDKCIVKHARCQNYVLYRQCKAVGNALHKNIGAEKIGAEKIQPTNHKNKRNKYSLKISRFITS